MMFLSRINNSLHSKLDRQQMRFLWEHINIVFNRLDEDRRRKLGPDRTCAEWILRNGGAVKFKNAPEYLLDYNALPPEETKLTIIEVDASNSSIAHYGFVHFVGCNELHKIILHKCDYIYDKALEELAPISSTLRHLQVSECHNVSDEGLLHLAKLKGLQQLNLHNFSAVKDLQAVVVKLRSQLPQCQITSA